MKTWSYTLETHSSRPHELDAPSFAEINGGEEPEVATLRQIEVAVRAARDLVASPSFSDGPRTVEISGETDAEPTELSGAGSVTIKISAERE